MAVIIENVKKKYDRLEALHGISMEVRNGSIHGLIGENGSGKTTLIKCITGVYRPDSGQITFDGDVIYENPAVKSRIGYVADNNNYFPGYRLGKMAEFYQKVYTKFDMNRFKELNKTFKLDMNKRISELSKGQKMRLAFMLNLAAKSDLLVMDEPTSGLDAIAKRQLFDLLISEVEEREMTVIISSHNLIELERICDSVTMIKEGRIAQNSDMDDIKKTVRKFNYVFENGAPKDFTDNSKIISMSNIGNIYTVVFSDISDEEIADLNKYNPLFVEELPINLEEVFVYSNGGAENER